MPNQSNLRMIKMMILKVELKCHQAFQFPARKTLTIMLTQQSKPQKMLHKLPQQVLKDLMKISQLLIPLSLLNLKLILNKEMLQGPSVYIRKRKISHQP